MNKKKQIVWLEYCPQCKRKHRVTLQPCPTCGVYETPQPVSDNVYLHCNGDKRCDGCQAYSEHLK